MPESLSNMAAAEGSIVGNLMKTQNITRFALVAVACGVANRIKTKAQEAMQCEPFQAPDGSSYIPPANFIEAVHEVLHDGASSGLRQLNNFVDTIASRTVKHD